MNRMKFLISIVTIVALSYIVGSNTSAAYAKEREDRICQGVYIDTIDISGMTEAEAQAAVDNLILELKDKQIAILVGNDVVHTTMGEIGYRCEKNHYVKQALGLATQGNLIKRYKDTKDIEHGKIVYPLTFTYSTGKCGFHQSERWICLYRSYRWK